MQTRSRATIFLAVLLVAGAAFWYANPFDWRSGAKTRAGGQFVELETAIASEIKAGWMVVAPPKVPGPYHRAEAGGPMLGGGGQGGAIIGRVRNAAGTVTEEVHLESDPVFDQLIVYLDTANGERTLVVMRRPR